MLPSVPPQMSVRCSSAHQDLVISIDFGINPRLPLFVVELLRDLFDLPISVGTIHNRLQSAADKAAAINLTQLVCNPSGTAGRNIPSQPVLVGSMPSQLTATYWRRLNTGMRTLGSASTGC